MTPSVMGRIRSILAACLRVIALAALTACARPAMCQDFWPGRLQVGDYFVTSPSGRAAIGGSKYVTEFEGLGIPIRLGRVAWLQTGLQAVTTNDIFFTKLTGNYFTLFGPMFRVTAPIRHTRFDTYAEAGYYLYYLRSENLGFATDVFVVSGALGVEWRFRRWAGLQLAYRFTPVVDGVNTDGVMLELRLF